MQILMILITLYGSIFQFLVTLQSIKVELNELSEQVNIVTYKTDSDKIKPSWRFTFRSINLEIFRNTAVQKVLKYFRSTIGKYASSKITIYFNFNFNFI